jgi:hypothetical protein
MDQKVTAPVKASLDKPAYNPILLMSYKVARKILKYGLYITLLYFAYEGFMAWK